MSGGLDERFRPRSVGLRITRLRKFRGKTQKELGSVLRVTGSAVSQMESGRGVKLTDLTTLATALEVHALELIAGLSADTCSVVDKLETLSPEQRVAAIRLFHSTLSMADAMSTWRGQPAT